MKICQPHWDRLRKRLDELGIGHLGAKSGEEAAKNIITEAEGRGAENDYDPLMACNMMIWSNGLRMCGIPALAADSCPICEATRMYEEEWITGPTSAALEECKRLGLVEHSDDQQLPDGK